MARLKDAVKMQTDTIETVKTAVNSFKANTEKNKMISAYVDVERYNKFQEINKRRNISNNKIINLLIADYVLQYERLLDD